MVAKGVAKASNFDEAVLKKQRQIVLLQKENEVGFEQIKICSMIPALNWTINEAIVAYLKNN